MRSKSCTALWCDICALNFPYARMFHRWNFIRTFLYFVQALKLTQFSPIFSRRCRLFVCLFACKQFFPVFSQIFLARALSAVSIWAMDIIYCKHWASVGRNIWKATTTTWRTNVKMYETKLMEKRDRNTAVFSFVFPLFPFTFPCHHVPFRVLFHYCACSSLLAIFFCFPAHFDALTNITQSQTRKWLERYARGWKMKDRKR